MFVLFSSACSAKPEYPEDFFYWQVGVISPSFYPVVVSQAYGVNEVEDWTSLIHNFVHWTYSRNDLDRIKDDYIKHYDGFGMPLDVSVVALNQQIIKYRSLPEEIYIFWTSLVDRKFYKIHFKISEELKQKIWTGTDIELFSRRTGKNYIQHCHQTSFIFGLLPNGDAQIWLYGCAKYSFLTKIKSQTMTTDWKGYSEKSYLKLHKKMLERAKQHGVELFPIPWDKVNKVYRANQPVSEQ